MIKPGVTRWWQPGETFPDLKDRAAVNALLTEVAGEAQLMPMFGKRAR